MALAVSSSACGLHILLFVFMIAMKTLLEISVTVSLYITEFQTHFCFKLPNILLAERVKKSKDDYELQGH